MHTSGSTGTPKPIVVTQGVFTGLDASQKVPSMYGLSTTSESWRDLRCFLTLPLFPVLPPPVPFNVKIANDVIVHGKVQAAELPPAVLVEISKVPEYLDNLRPLNSVMTGGGPLPNGPGDLISSRTHLFVGFGSTETGHIQNAFPPRGDWDYFDFSTAFGVEMRHYSDELYEIVIIFQNTRRAIFFLSILRKKNLWRHEGRSDDIIVYSSGEKFNPISMESHLGSHPEVKAAVVYGDKKFQSALLIEPVQPEKSKEALLDELWPTIETANATSPAHARIMSKDFVTFATADKPLPRAGKGTKRTLGTPRMGTPTNGHTTNGHVTNENDYTLERTKDDLQDTIIQALVSLQGFKEILPSENWFELGMDSLGVITLARALNIAFGPHNSSQKSVSESMIYSYPSAEKLASALSGAGDDENESQDKMKKEYERYAFELPIVARPSTPIAGPKVFLLTGSTGSLGSYILESLLKEDKSCKIYCLNRGEDSEERQRSSSSSKGLSTDFERVKFLSMATGTEEPWLGIKIGQYKLLLDEVTHIIHNAWQVDFNVSLEQLGAAHIRRVRQLIDFSAHSRHGCSIHFISSISSVGNWDIACDSPQSRVPEASFEDWSIPQGSGYGQAKYVAERVLAAAASVAGIPVSIYRVGQIAGPKSSQGKWNEQEWFPMILRSSNYLGVLPSSLGPLEAVDWIPVDVLGKVIHELVSASHPQCPNSKSAINGHPGSEPTVYHVVNPKRTIYSDAILPRLKALLDLPAVSFEDWVHRLRDSAAKTRDVEINDNPGVKLLGFYEELVSQGKEGRSQPWLKTEKSVEGSSTLKNMDAIDEKCIDNWLKQWGYIRNENAAQDHGWSNTKVVNLYNAKYGYCS
ncbi:hypothetical protein EYC84_001021 [Monilinia fructicola]|uniref:Polyketide synthase-like phosphopantetheine-binding domain-containing protein n=1 Tax=Monilinia fructicola TaxID=38448 RepID=A0A5M9JLW8_MONFR|nr:hypothetical protein EYC84_001021 [Monilinia fructicola]